MKKHKQSRRIGVLAIGFISFILIFLSVGVPVSYAAEVTVFMGVDNISSGIIAGDATLAGREGRHKVYEIQHQIEIPRDSSGLPSGQRIHHPFMVTTNYNVGTPEFYQACTTGSPSTVTLDYYRANDSGMDEIYFTVELEDALIVDMQHKKPDILNPENSDYGDMISLSFVYSKITWKYYGETYREYSDNWTSPKI